MDPDAFNPNLSIARTDGAVGNRYWELIILATYNVKLSMRVCGPFVPYLINIIPPFKGISTKL
jgi:hypothetical protein